MRKLSTSICLHTIGREVLYLASLCFLFLFVQWELIAQDNLEIEGDGAEFIRLHSTDELNGQAGLEMIFSDAGDQNHYDWRLVNDKGTLKFLSSNDSFITTLKERMRITSNGDVGIGTGNPEARLHIFSGPQVSESSPGFFMIGPAGSNHLCLDDNEIDCKVDDLGLPLYLQRYGGDSYIGHLGGKSHLSTNNKELIIGPENTGSGTSLSILRNDYDLQLRNEAGELNNWFLDASCDEEYDTKVLRIGASKAANDVRLELMHVSDNDGITAPVNIRSDQGTARLLLDGNEIDSQTPLYINHNTNQDTYINPSGGRVAIGTTSATEILSIDNSNWQGGLPLSIESPTLKWNLGSLNIGQGDFHFENDDHGLVGWISSNDFAYVSVSDLSLKTNVRPIESKLEQLCNITTFTYHLKNDEDRSKNIGIIAQDLQQDFPSVVSQRNGYLGVDFAQFSTMILSMSKELALENDSLQKKLKIQQDHLKELKEKWAVIKERNKKAVK